MYDIPLIKSRITCIDYAQRMGLPIRKDGDRCTSPFRSGANNQSAFSVHRDYWHDFVSGDSGDVIDLCALAKHNGDRGHAMMELAGLTGVSSGDDYVDWVQRTQHRVSTIQGWHEDLRPQDREYLYSRRIKEETIQRLRIGFTGLGVNLTINGEKVYGFAAGRIAIPAYKNGYVVSWVARATKSEQTPKYLKPPTDELTENEPWGLQTLNRGSDDIYIAEGAFDYLSIEQSNLPVLASMGGYFGHDTMRSVLSIVKDFKRVVLTFDNDEAGRKFTLNMGNTFFTHRIPFAVAVIPPKYKDIADYYADNGEITALELQNGIEFLATYQKDKDAFKNFVRKAARTMERSELSELFSASVKAETFNSAWLKEVQASCYKPPPEPVIMEEILKQHHLLYFPNVGFYEYLTIGKWELLNDEVIHGYISDALGVFRAGGRLEPIKKLMRPEVLTSITFDRAPVINFVNGTLELETGLFREHSPDDYCSIQLPYPYLPEARAPRWEQFIDEITVHDEKRKENLQFIAGYTLFSDCRHEKIFALIGEGGNGKSLFTKILTQLFGPDNVRSITPIGLTEAFEAIHLRNALLNIAGEIKSDLANTEERLKQLASGEPIQACYKGKDNITFVSRAKLIFCCNGQLRSSDTSDGLSRRLVIIDFPCKFVEFPDPADPYQREKDIMLYDKLMLELSGIFNWAYRGYRDLLNFNSFTETDEHQQLMKAFRQASNPIECFVDDLMDNPLRETSFPSMYRMYVAWCEDNGHKPMSSTRFHPEFKRCSKKLFSWSVRAVRTPEGPRKEHVYTMLLNT